MKNLIQKVRGENNKINGKKAGKLSKEKAKIYVQKQKEILN